MKALYSLLDNRLAGAGAVGVVVYLNQYAVVTLRMHHLHALQVVVAHRLDLFACLDIIDGIGEGLLDLKDELPCERLAGSLRALAEAGRINRGSERYSSLVGIVSENGIVALDRQSAVT